MACHALKMGSFHLCTPNGLGSFLEKHIFEPFFTHFLSQNSPFSRHLGILGGLKRATMSSKRAKNTSFGIPCGTGSFLKKAFFFALGGPCCPILAPTSLGYLLQLAAAHWA